MGSNIIDWATANGAYYVGANTTWEIVWTVIAFGLCVIALISGAQHELDAYEELEDKD